MHTSAHTRTLKFPCVSLLSNGRNGFEWWSEDLAKLLNCAQGSDKCPLNSPLSLCSFTSSDICATRFRVSIREWFSRSLTWYRSKSVFGDFACRLCLRYHCCSLQLLNEMYVGMGSGNLSLVVIPVKNTKSPIKILHNNHYYTEWINLVALGHNPKCLHALSRVADEQRWRQTYHLETANVTHWELQRMPYTQNSWSNGSNSNSWMKQSATTTS